MLTESQLSELNESFNTLDENEQWVWIVNTNFKDDLTISLDNDTTAIYFKDDILANYILYFKSDIGNRSGVVHLFAAIGIIAEKV